MAALTYTKAQELLVGGNMEDDQAWQFSTPNGSDAADLVTPTFNYTEDMPTGGAGGCLELTGYGQTRSVTWQEITIVPGDTYSFTGFVKNISADALENTWIEVILSRTEPNPDTDYGAGFGDYIYSNNSWMAAPYGDFTELDGDLLSTMQLSLKGNGDDVADEVLTEPTFVIPDTISTNIWYVAIKAGCWNTAGDDNPTFDFLFDELSLIDQDGVSVRSTAVNKMLEIFPNPSTGLVNLKLDEPASIKVYNTLGKEVKSMNLNNQMNSIDLSDLNKGIYIIKADNGKETTLNKLILE